jgi:hypothetical protein
MAHSRPAARKQLMHIVVGGVLEDLDDVVFENLEDLHFVGAYPNYALAHQAWKGAAQATVDSARTRYFIIHAHRLLDPDPVEDEEDAEDRTAHERRR